MEKIDQEVMQVLETEPEQGAELIDILARLGSDPEKVNMSLIRLRKQGLVALDNRLYKTTESGRNNAIFNAKCPACGSIRLVANDKQAIVYCPNPDCKTESGRRRTFWILGRIRKDGLRRRINTVE